MRPEAAAVWVVRVRAQARCSQRTWRTASARSARWPPRALKSQSVSCRAGVSRASDSKYSVFMASGTSQVSARDQRSSRSPVVADHDPPRASTVHLVVQQDIPVLTEFSVPDLMELWAGDARSRSHRGWFEPHRISLVWVIGRAIV